MPFAMTRSGPARLAALAVLFGLAACAGESRQALTSVPLATPSIIPAAPTATFAPTPEATEPAPLRLVIWWPEPLAPVGDLAAAAALAAQLDGFGVANPNVILESRLKKPGDVGGIIETLRAASAVAPGALPDLTLLRRRDLLAAAQNGLAQPLEGRVSSATLGDLYTAALALGQVDGQLYGLPYTLDVLHIAYRGEYPSGDFALFEDVLAAGRSFVFPAGAASGVSEVFLLQYLSAGGDLADISLGAVNETALLAALDFYQQAVADGLIDTLALTYTSPDDYLSALRDRAVNAAVVSSTSYLEISARGQVLGFAPIPAQSGQPTTVLDGWMWVLTTTDADRQALAAHFLDWMFEVERQRVYSAAIHMLPSQRAALRQAGFDTAYADFVTQLLGRAILPLTETGGGTTARAMQNALAAVIGGQRTAQEAAQDVMNQLAG